ncbi:MAG: hypothetical protein KAY32_16620 [Candidatus Eisenbacteria sp.]|nr:hypothetical protein [Candidatus Eisenbacteria bacterium]
MTGSVDVAIVTALEEEFTAVKNRLGNAKRHKPKAKDPRLYSWTLGELASDQGGTYSVVLARLPHAGQAHSGVATSKTIDRWKPRYVFFVGIAGGFAKDGIELGDVVLSDAIWGYEYGKIDQAGHFQPRLEVDPEIRTVC